MMSTIDNSKRVEAVSGYVRCEELTAINAATIRRRFDEAPMSATQVRAVVVAILLAATDGYDVLSAALAAPAISKAWGIGKDSLGIVLSSGLAGMALGSLLLAPLADWLGRRKMIFCSLSLMGLGSLLSATAYSIVGLVAWRVLTGLGVGACVSLLYPIAAEFANARRRSLSLALTSVGYPTGGLVGGMLAATLLRHFGWPAVFVPGFLAALVLLPITAWMLPETPAFLLSRDVPDQLSRLNALLARCGHPELIEFSKHVAINRKTTSIFAPRQIGTTLRLAIVNLLAAAVVYYLLSWLPQMVSDAGFSLSVASLASATSSLIGIIGGVTLGLIARPANLKWLTVTLVAAMGLTIILFGSVPASLGLIVAGAATCGLFVFSSYAGIYAILPSAFPDEARVSGVGFVIGIGRISSAIAPYLAGRMFAAGLGRAEVSAAFGACALISSIVLATHRKP